MGAQRSADAGLVAELSETNSLLPALLFLSLFSPLISIAYRFSGQANERGIMAYCDDKRVHLHNLKAIRAGGAR